MAFSTQDSDEVLSEINVTPLVDVMLVLLVVFIVTAPLLTNSIPINLPKTESVAPPEQKDPLVVSIDGAGKLFVNKDEIQPELLESNLAAAKAKDAEVRAVAGRRRGELRPGGEGHGFHRARRDHQAGGDHRTLKRIHAVRRRPGGHGFDRSDPGRESGLLFRMDAPRACPPRPGSRMRRAPRPALARPTPGCSGLACRRLLLLGVLRSFDFPFTGPVLAEQFAGMLGAAGAVAAAHRFRRAIAVATPADALRMAGMERKFLAMILSRYLMPALRYTADGLRRPGVAAESGFGLRWINSIGVYVLIEY